MGEDKDVRLVCRIPDELMDQFRHVINRYGETQKFLYLCVEEASKVLLQVAPNESNPSPTIYELVKQAKAG